MKSNLEFVTALRAFLQENLDHHVPVLPLVVDDEGSIQRKETLKLPCYSGFQNRDFTKEESCV